jgi:hypothetical protein
VIYGHSHEPYDEIGVEGQRLFNRAHPPSAVERRTTPMAGSTSSPDKSFFTRSFAFLLKVSADRADTGKA